MKGFFKILAKNEWYFILVFIVFMFLAWLNKIGYGAILIAENAELAEKSQREISALSPEGYRDGERTLR